jgi:hypothetical protein
MLQKEPFLEETFIKVPLSEIPKLFEILLTVVFISYDFGKTKRQALVRLSCLLPTSASGIFFAKHFQYLPINNLFWFFNWFIIQHIVFIC